MSSSAAPSGGCEGDSEGILSPLIGHDGAKAVLRAAIRSGDVHLMLEGPPESGKSVAMTAIEDAVESAIYRDASGYTKAQLREVLAEDHRILMLDEIDDMDPTAYEALPVAMEHGRVTKDTARESYDKAIRTQIIAACNNPGQLPNKLQSRFRHVRFHEYDTETYLDVCSQVLANEVGWIDDQGTAMEVVKTVHGITGNTSPREARDIAKLAGRLEEVRPIAIGLSDATAEVDSSPLRPEELEEINAEDSGGGALNTQESVHGGMATPGDVQTRSVDEVQEMIDSAGVDIDTDVGGGGGEGEWALGWEWINQMHERGEQVLDNSFSHPIIEIYVPRDADDEYQDLVNEFAFDTSERFAGKSAPDLESQIGEAGEGITAFQIMLDNRSNLDSGGFNMNALFDALEGEPVVFTTSSLVDVDLPV